MRFPGQQVYGIGKQSSILLTVDFSGEKVQKNYSRNTEQKLQKIFNDDILNNIKGVFSASSEYTFLPLYEEILSLSPNDEEAGNAIVNELIYKLKSEYYKKIYENLKPHKSYALTVLNYMKNNLEKNITLDLVASQVNLNKSYLVRLFKATYGKTPIHVLNSLRMEKAFDLIINTNMNISQIAFECGYSSDSYFISEYKKHFGETPLKTRSKRLR